MRRFHLYQVPDDWSSVYLRHRKYGDEVTTSLVSMGTSMEGGRKETRSNFCFQSIFSDFEKIITKLSLLYPRCFHRGAIVLSKDCPHLGSLDNGHLMKSEYYQMVFFFNNLRIIETETKCKVSLNLGVTLVFDGFLPNPFATQPELPPPGWVCKSKTTDLVQDKYNFVAALVGYLDEYMEETFSSFPESLQWFDPFGYLPMYEYEKRL